MAVRSAVPSTRAAADENKHRRPQKIKDDALYEQLIASVHRCVEKDPTRLRLLAVDKSTDKRMRPVLTACFFVTDATSGNVDDDLSQSTPPLPRAHRFVEASRPALEKAALS